jgi:allantoinase
VLDEEAATKYGPYAKCNPPLRSRENVERLRQAVFTGEVDCIVSDHSPYTTDAKDRGWSDIHDCPPGINGLQFGLPLVYDEGVRRRGLPLQRLVALFSANAARLFGVYPRKGTLRVGSDADFVLFDPETRWTVERAGLFCKNPWSPYIGREIQGQVHSTWMRGTLVYDGGFPAGPGFGQFLRPMPQP